MPDEPDATRPIPPHRPNPDDATRIGGAGHGYDPDATRISRGGNADPDATRIGGAPGFDPDATRVGGAVGGRPDATRVGGAPVPDDGARWSARAGVPQPGDPALRRQVPVEQWVEEDPYQGRSWLQPVIIGTVVVALIAALSVGLYLIYRATGGEGEQTAAPTVAASSAGPPVQTQTPTKSSPPPTSAVPSATAPEEPVIVTIPPLRGSTVPEATIKLTQLGLKVKTETRADTSVQPGEVIESNPGEGALAEPGTTITLYVAATPSPSPSMTTS